jgi:hypothetical protein
VLPYASDLQLLADSPELAVIFAFLRGSKQRVVLKGWSAERAYYASAQLRAETLAARLFGGKDPTLITPAAVSGNSASGNYTTASTYGGISLKDLIASQAWQEAPPAVRAAVCQRMAVCIFRALDKLNAAVSDTWGCPAAHCSSHAALHICACVCIRTASRMRAVCICSIGSKHSIMPGSSVPPAVSTAYIGTQMCSLDVCNELVPQRQQTQHHY